jgi:hypothetical protein
MGSPIVLARSPTAHQPETDGGVRDSVIADLLESEIKQAVETDPRPDEAQDMRRIKKMAGRRGTDQNGRTAAVRHRHDLLDPTGPPHRGRS